MTHEYVIGLSGTILSTTDPATAGAARNSEGANAESATAIAWAADRILAVGSDAAVRAISRGDSVFLNLDGCLVTPLPAGLPPDAAMAPDGVGPAGAAMAPDGAMADGPSLEPGEPADLAFWQPGPGEDDPGGRHRWRLVAIVRAGAFTTGEPHHGPFAEARSTH